MTIDKCANIAFTKSTIILFFCFVFLDNFTRLIFAFIGGALKGSDI